MSCGSCGGAYVPQRFDPMGERHEGDILAETLYSPRPVNGRATGRTYPRVMHTGAQMWVDPRDVALDPTMWRAVIDVQSISPDVATVLELAERSVATRVEPAPIPERVERKSTSVEKPKRTRRARKAG